MWYLSRPKPMPQSPLLSRGRQPQPALERPGLLVGSAPREDRLGAQPARGERLPTNGLAGRALAGEPDEGVAAGRSSLFASLAAKMTQETMPQVPSQFVPRSRAAHADILAASYHEVASMQGEPPMKTLVSIITLGLAVAFAAPAFAADKAPASKSACEKAHMTWDATAKKCK